MCHVLHNAEGKRGEIKTLGSTEDACELSCASENDQSEAFHWRHIKNYKVYMDTDSNKIADEKITVPCFSL